jgi:hypothetical protein
MSFNDQIGGKNEISAGPMIQLAPTFMKKDLHDKFMVVMMAPGLLLDEIEVKVFQEKKPLLSISGQSGRRFVSNHPYSYNLFQQYVLLPDKVVLDTLEKSMQEGLFVCSFRKDVAA